LDARTGKILWQNKYGDRMTPAGVFTSALGWNGKIYYANSHGKVQGVAAKTGKHHWQHNYNNSWISSPVLANNLLFWSNSGNRGPGGPPGYLYAFDPSSGDQLGETEVGFNVHSTPAAKNGKIYLGSNEKKGGALHVFKYWLRRLEKKRPVAGGESPVRHLVRGNGQLAYAADGQLSVVDEYDGKLLWRFESKYGQISRLVLEDSRLLVGTYDRRVHLFDWHSGDRLWSVRLSEPLERRPVFWKDRVIIPQDRGGLTALRFKDGKKIWTRRDYELPRALVQSDSELFLATGSGTLRLIDPADGSRRWARALNDHFYDVREIGNKIYICGRKYLYSFSKSSRKIEWKHRNFGVHGLPVLSGEKIIYGDWAGYVYAVDQATGKSIWEKNTGSAIKGGPLVAGDLAWVGTAGGELIGLEPRSGREVLRTSAGPRITGLISGKKRDQLLVGAGEEGAVAFKQRIERPGYAGQQSPEFLSHIDPGRPMDSLGEYKNINPRLKPVADGRQLFVPEDGQIKAFSVLPRPAEMAYFRGDRQRRGHFQPLRGGQGLKRIWKRQLENRLIHPPLLTPNLLLLPGPEKIIALDRETGTSIWSIRSASPLEGLAFNAKFDGFYAVFENGSLVEYDFAGNRVRNNFPRADYQYIAHTNNQRLVVATGADTLHFRVLETDKNKFRFSGGPATESTSGEAVAFGGGKLFYFARNRRGRGLIREFRPQTGQKGIELMLPRNVNGVNLQFRGNRLFVSAKINSGPNEMLVYDLYSGRLLWRDDEVKKSPKGGQPLITKNYVIRVAPWNSRGKLTLIYQDAETGELLWKKYLTGNGHFVHPDFPPVFAPPYLYIPQAGDKFFGYELDE
ncbi:MAG: PQQ-binding-like beta-propeller repeat protein, partial [bacterium]